MAKKRKSPVKPDAPRKIPDREKLKGILDDVKDLEVESINSVRIRKNNIQYLIKWKGFDEKDNSWSNESDCQCEEKINQFYDQQTQVLTSNLSDKEREFFDWSKEKLGYSLWAADHVLKRNYFVPPVSPHHLIQEILFYDPWKMTIACMLLNRTSGRVVRHVIYKLFIRYPNPKEMIEKGDITDIAAIIQPLGLIKRAEYIHTLSRQFLTGCWKTPIELKGVGKYAEDAYKIFCCGDYKLVQPEDHALNKYHEWIMKEGDVESKGEVSHDDLVWGAHLKHEEMKEDEKEWWQTTREMRMEFAKRMIQLKA
ncbi:methyl-CpG-binding domain protein 4 [Planoprotostelium fungivorum]|uniref:Methyl-CpG-binding domain protein 4 n=1 Tax=Planoprotostelium fungivorum TaxID=1890364 RepID=A0A2P6NYQ6_9EUKA|nr:methyl-CpG-binding domain protein 4 [Planoprotostelium fungivorum]